ncbi:hypothetical protein JCM10908_005914 [Rhodotorula pacifica]|uniref:uncharacterized protein n=1 Tax=Rhodotorula pacifica TaxID=1495444 RepID=UPI00318187CC
MPRSMTRTSPSAWLLATVLGLAATKIAVAQSAADIGTEQNTLSTLIPGACSATCAAWLASLGACPAATSSTYSTCVCDQTFVNNFAACAPCLATQLTAGNDAANAATANQAPTDTVLGIEAEEGTDHIPAADLTNYCATAGTAVTTASTTSTTATSTTSTTSSIATAVSSAGGLNAEGIHTLFTPTTPLLTYSTVSSTASSLSDSLELGTSTTGVAGPVTIFQSGQNLPFPTQTKSTNAFASGAEGNAQGRNGMAAVVVAVMAVAGGWMLA